MWALLNLLCCIVSAIISVLMLARMLKKQEEQDEIEAEAVKAEAEAEEKKERKLKQVSGLLPTVAAIITFILTENIHLPMAWRDKWTPLMVVYAGIALLLAWVTRRKKADKETEDSHKEEPVKA